MPEPKKKNTIGISLLRIFSDLKWIVKKGPLPYFFVLLLLWIGWYVFLYWGYHTSHFSHNFDNFVQETGVWRIFGAKNYENAATDVYFIDPRIDVNERYYREYVSTGTIVSINPQSYEFSLDHYQDGVVPMVVGSETYITMIVGGEVRFCPDCTLENLIPGDYVTVIEVDEIDVENSTVEAGNYYIEKHLDE